MFTVVHLQLTLYADYVFFYASLFFFYHKPLYLCTKLNQCAPLTWLELLKHTPNCFLHNLIVCNLMQRYRKKCIPCLSSVFLNVRYSKVQRGRNTEDNTDRNRTGIMYLFHCFCYRYLLENSICLSISLILVPSMAPCNSWLRSLHYAVVNYTKHRRRKYPLFFYSVFYSR